MVAGDILRLEAVSEELEPVLWRLIAGIELSLCQSDLPSVGTLGSYSSPSVLFRLPSVPISLLSSIARLIISSSS